MSDFIEWGALGNIIWVGILVGAGLPALFALGVRAIASENARDENGQIPLVRRAVAWFSFGVAIAACFAGIGLLVVGGHA